MPKKGYQYEKFVVVCSKCGRDFLTPYRRSVPRCPECAKKEDRKRRRLAYHLKKEQSGEPVKQRGLVCPYSPDCQKCPKPDCVIEFAHRYNIVEGDFYANRITKD